MSNDRVSGLALIAGSSGMIITMVLHPTGRVAPGQLEAMIPMLIAVHGLALACLPVMFLGSWGLSQRLARGGHLAVSALVVYTFGLVAIMSAAVFDGLVTPAVLRQMVASAGAQPAIDSWRMISHYNFYVNQGYAQVFVTAASVAIILWSVAAWRTRALARGLGIYGCILGAVALIALFSGHLSLDKHGASIVIFAQAAWFIVAGAILWQQYDQGAASAKQGSCV